MNLRQGTLRRPYLLVAVIATVITASVANDLRAELPTGWNVEINAGTIRDINTSGGIIACATDGGLLFFQPSSNSFQQIADAGCTDGDCLRSNKLTSLDRDDKGQYWLGTQGSGLVVFRPGVSGKQFGWFFNSSLSFGGQLLSDSVTCVSVWRDQTVYAGTMQGVAQIDLAGGVETYNEDASRTAADGLFRQAVNDVAVDSAFVWVAQDSGVVRYSRQANSQVERIVEGLNGDGVNVLEIFNDDLYAGTSRGVAKWNETLGRWERIENCSTCPPTPDLEVLSLAALPNTDPVRLMVGTQQQGGAIPAAGSVWLFTGFVWGLQNPPGIFLLGDRFFEAMAATGDTVWTSQINDDGEGAYLEAWNPQDGWSRHQPSAIPASEVKFLDVDPANGDLWVATRLSGIGRRSASGTWCEFNANDDSVRTNSTQGPASAFMVDQNRAVWFSTLPGGASADVDELRASPNCDHTADVWLHVRPGEFDFGGRYRRMVEDGLGHRYFLADGDVPSPGGIDVLSNDKSRFKAIRGDFLGGNNIGGMAFSTSSGLWDRAYVGVSDRGQNGLLQWINSGTEDDIFEPTADNFSFLPLDFGVSDYRDIAVEGDGRRFWVATGAGIFRYDADIRTAVLTVGVRVGAPPGLLSGDTRDLLIDGFNNLWIASAGGLNRINLTELSRTGRLQIDAFSTLGKITELNNAAPPSVGRLYDPLTTVAPLPGPSATSLAFNPNTGMLYVATEGGVAIANVALLGAEAVIPIEKAILYPNPVRVLDGDEQVRLAGVSEPATVTIFNLEGEMVLQTSNVRDGNVAWDLGTASARFRATSGIYLVRVTTSQGSKMTPLVVIR